MNKVVYHTDVNMICHNKNVMKMKYKHYHLWILKYTRYCIYYHYVLKCKKEKCIWKIFVKYTQIRLSNTNTNTNISSCGFSNTNTNTDICVFKYKYKYVFDPSPVDYVLSMWGKIMIPMYRLWLHSLYGPHCLLSPKRLLNLITHSPSELIR